MFDLSVHIFVILAITQLCENGCMRMVYLKIAASGWISTI